MPTYPAVLSAVRLCVVGMALSFVGALSLAYIGSRGLAVAVPAVAVLGLAAVLVVLRLRRLTSDAPLDLVDSMMSAALYAAVKDLLRRRR